MQSEQIMPPNSQIDMLFWAFRYALGRSTYVVSEVAEQIILSWDMLPDEIRRMIRREIKDALERGAAGMDCDRQQWKRVLDLGE